MTTWGKLNFENNYFAISKGEVSDHSVVFISGKNPQVDAGTVPETVWNVGGLYPWSAWNGSGKTLYIVSTSTSDTYNVILSGLDENYNLLTHIVTLNGTTPVDTGLVKFRRLNSALYMDSGASNVGTITIRCGAVDGFIVGQMTAGQAVTSMSIYTVPAGYTAYSVYGDFSCNKNENAELNARWRFFGSSFITVYATEVYQQHIVTTPPVPGAIPEKTDIDNQVALVSNNGTRVYSNQQLILVKNNALHV